MRLKVYIHVLLTVTFVIFFPSGVNAKVSGQCSNCHTMHNSQDGTAVAYQLNAGYSGYDTDTTPNSYLLVSNCAGCHSSTASATIDGDNTPIVFNTGSFSNPLAGGNFSYVQSDELKGHNVIDLDADGDGTLSAPPGDENTTGITNANFTCSGTYGCHGDRTVDDKFIAIKGSHHTDDSVLKFATINTSAQGGTVGLSYRFLKGVKGGEDANWEGVSPSATVHNEYFGATAFSEGSISTPGGGTISGLCAECHGNFHGTGDAGSSSPWIRHPTDFTLPSTTAKEYYAYNGGTGTNNTYSLVAPVARTTITAVSGVVNPGTGDAIVMCLSCHRAHASDYHKILRWNIKGTLSQAMSGCIVCHTSKD